MPMKYLWRTAATLVLGCSSTPIEVGSNYVEGDEGQWGWTQEQACSGGTQLPIVGTWVGYTDRQRAPSGSDAVRLVITRANAKHICGTLTIGREAPPWPAITDSEAPYPPDLGGTLRDSFAAYLALLEGVPLTLTAARVGLPQVLFRASYGQWKNWCARQTPYLCEGLATPEYFCVPASGPGGLLPRVRHTDKGCETDYGGETIPVDCGKAALCLGGPCTCNGSECMAPPLWGFDYELEFQGDAAIGDGLYLRRVR
jgi:hypothetical protein